jgi:tubulin-specific chaperone A
MQNSLVKQLKIKSSGLKRMQKEYFGYKKEEEKQKERIATLTMHGSDEADIKKQVIQF